MLPAIVSNAYPPTIDSAGMSAMLTVATIHQAASTSQARMVPAIAMSGLRVAAASANKPTVRMASSRAIPHIAACATAPPARKKRRAMLTRARIEPAPCGSSGAPRRRATTGTPIKNKPNTP